MNNNKTLYQDPDSIANNTLLWKLLTDHPEFVANVPQHWLDQDAPSRDQCYTYNFLYDNC